MTIDKPDQLASLVGKTVFLYPVYNDPTQHPSQTQIIAVVVVELDTKRTHSISFCHPDGLYQSPHNFGFLASSVVYAYDCTALKYCGFDVSNFIDSKAQYYLYSNQACNFETPEVVAHYSKIYPQCTAIGSIVSLHKHEEIAKELSQKVVIRDIQPGLSFYQTTLLPAIHWVESSGLKTVDGFVHTQYNPYTTTGRPSNRFAGVNYAALSKTDGSRDRFVSRFGSDGVLVEIDFNAYHPRLIASLVGYEFTRESAYQQLATELFGINPSSAQVEKTKEDTFRQIYGGVQEHLLQTPFFKAADQLSQLLWMEFNKQDYLESPLSGRRLHSRFFTKMTRSMLFNYFIQMYETETNMLMLIRLYNQFTNIEAKPILYTYDSVLFDVPIGELDKLRTILAEQINLAQFPIKIKRGCNYGSMATLS